MDSSKADTKFNDAGDIYAIYVLNGKFITGLINMISLEDVGYSMLLDGQYNLLLGDEEIYEKYEKQTEDELAKCFDKLRRCGWCHLLFSLKISSVRADGTDKKQRGRDREYRIKAFGMSKKFSKRV